MFNSRIFKVLLIAVLVTIIAGTAYAFADANTVPDTKAGDGLGTVSGYTITSVVYTLNGTDPSTLDSVAFDVGAAAVTVKAQLVATTGLTVSSIDQLRVIAASN